jgi:hypothetical protein
MMIYINYNNVQNIYEEACLLQDVERKREREREKERERERERERESERERERERKRERERESRSTKLKLYLIPQLYLVNEIFCRLLFNSIFSNVYGKIIN